MQNPLKISDYATSVKLLEPYEHIPNKDLNKEVLLNSLLIYLGQNSALDQAYAQKRRLLHAIINTLDPNTFNDKAIDTLNNLLQLELKEKQITHLDDIPNLLALKHSGTEIKIWQGDISTLQIDAIVNAANSQMLGCFQPLHACIDNVIHSAAGVQLRDDCNIIMQKQGFEEPNGSAKITRAYNLPSKFVIHTVGPIVYHEVGKQEKEDLANSYISCLNICKEIDEIRSIAFCGISTGVFGYPADKAIPLALKTVKTWLKQNPAYLDIVVFNTFTDRDTAIFTKEI